jgi:hypothetical protein
MVNGIFSGQFAPMNNPQDWKMELEYIIEIASVMVYKCAIKLMACRHGVNLRTTYMYIQMHNINSKALSVTAETVFKSLLFQVQQRTPRRLLL